MNFHKETIKFTLNKKKVSSIENLNVRLSEFLRESQKIKGTKVGCNAGDCGSCTILMDNNPFCSCLLTLGKIKNKKIETIEGVSEDKQFILLKKSLSIHGAAQCGICTPGIIMSALALLRKNKFPKKEEVEFALSGVLCRCTGYQKIINAVMNVNKITENKNTSSNNMKEVGKRIERIDGEKKLDGTEIFGDDFSPENSLLIKVLRSPFNRASFTIGNYKDWIEKNHGIEIVLTEKDIPGKNIFGVIPPFADQPVLAKKKVNFRGEAVAIIAGSYDSIKNLNLDTFPITWIKDDDVMTIDDSLNTKVKIGNENLENNILTFGKVLTGNPEKNVSTEFKVNGILETSYVEHAYIEPEAGSAWMEKNVLVIQACTQAPYMDRDDTAKILGMEPDNIRIIPSATGGGFGSKLDISIQPYLGLVALKTKKPCRIVYSRNESMISTTKRHPGLMSSSISCDSKGFLNSINFSGDFNTGAYASWGPTVANRVPVHASGPYRVPNYQAVGRAIHTNGPVAGAFRGFGVPQATALQETLMDQLADKLQIDQLEFRLKNSLKDGDKTVCGQKLDSVGIIDCLEALKENWKQKKESYITFNKTSKRYKKGVGIATCWYGCGNTALPNPSTIKIGLTKDGKISLHQGATDIGQGSNTVIAQITADAIGVSIENINLVSPDTFLTPDCGKTSASRQTYVTGKAAYNAGFKLRSKILRLSNMGNDSLIKIEKNELIISNQDKRQKIDLTKLQLIENDYVLIAEETYDPPTTSLDENGQGIPYAIYGYGAQMAEITVDTELGLLKIDKITAAHDLGKTINPLLAEGQIEGGIAQGIGFALMEEYIPSKTENLHDYLIPSIGDVPEIESILIEKNDPEGPFGARGLGEHVLIPTAPAIMNALRNATGAIITKLPALPDRILEAIEISKNGSSK